MKKINVAEMKDASLFLETKLTDEQKLDLTCKDMQSSETSTDSNMLLSDTKSLTSLTYVGNPEPQTSRPPIPLPSDVDIDESHNHVRQLFTAIHTKSDLKAPEKSSEDSKVKVKVSSEVTVGVKKFTDVTRTSCNQNIVFDSLSQTTSQKGRNVYRSPWKFKQGLKRTGLLQKSSHNLSVVMKVWRKQTTQPLGLASDSLAISGTEATSTSNNIEEFGLEKFDHIAYRQKKGYYLENFLRSLNTVLSQPQDLKLLNDDDLKVIETFKGLSLSAQKLYVRLFQRKTKWNRVFKIEYRDICDKEDTQLYVNELGSAKFVHQENELVNLEEILLLLTCEELRGLCKQMKISSTGKKEELISSLLESIEEKTILSERYAGRCIV
ncbi:uncharacterized protein [Panulirus ornatus]|uniref:uncharacterized protein isoform X2 n=1 Tax=Panulirus ornatus TaxID=150431 RepID=UPI003A86048A